MIQLVYNMNEIHFEDHNRFCGIWTVAYYSKSNNVNTLTKPEGRIEDTYHHMKPDAFKYRPILIVVHDKCFSTDRYWYTLNIPVSTNTSTYKVYQYRLIWYTETSNIDRYWYTENVPVSTDTGTISRSSIDRYLHTSLWDLVKYTFSNNCIHGWQIHTTWILYWPYHSYV